MAVLPVISLSAHIPCRAADSGRSAAEKKLLRRMRYESCGNEKSQTAEMVFQTDIQQLNLLQKQGSYINDRPQIFTAGGFIISFFYCCNSKVLSPQNAVVTYREDVHIAILRLPAESIIVIFGGSAHVSVREDSGALDISGIGRDRVPVDMGAVL